MQSRINRLRKQFRKWLKIVLVVGICFTLVYFEDAEREKKMKTKLLKAFISDGLFSLLIQSINR